MAKETPTAVRHGRFYDALENEELECRAIMACDMNGILGYDNDLIFHNERDMEFFREKTMDQLVVMGRKTFESMGSKGLKGRINVVISKAPSFPKEAYEKMKAETKYDDSEAPVEFMATTSQLLDFCTKVDRKKIWVIGGGKIYGMFSGYCRSIIITYYRTNLLTDGVKYGLLPEGFQKGKLTKFAYLPWVRQHPGTLLEVGKLPVTTTDGKSEEISWSILAYTMHQSKTSTAAARALRDENKKMSDAGYLYKGGKYDRTKNPK